MKAWRFHGFGDMRLDEVPEPVCRPGHVIAEPLCVQPSVTEAQLAFGIPTLAYEAIKRRLETEAPVQLFGHEFCARVVEVGEGVTRVRPGDRVAARAKLPCGSCAFCLEGKNYLCRKGPIIGFQLPGCFAERALLPEIARCALTIGSRTARPPAYNPSATASRPWRLPASPSATPSRSMDKEAWDWSASRSPAPAVRD